MMDVHAIRLVCGIGALSVAMFIAAMVALAVTEPGFFGTVIVGMLAAYPIGYAIERVVL